MYVTNLIPEGVIQILGKVLLHSIWVLGLAAFILWIVLALLKNHSARLKYNFSLGILFISLLGLVYTFMLVSREGRGFDDIRLNGASAKEVILNPSLDKNPEKKIFHTRAMVENHIQSFFQLYERNTNLIVFIWLTGIFLFSLRTTGGFVYISKLKNKGTTVLSNKWMNRFVDLSGKIKIHQKIKILISTRVKTPMVIGFIKPIILVPISIITHLPVEQVDAIIAHELAHIKRNDYLINLIQTFFEILFFYHPCVWWISNVIRKERENCCDDIAVSMCGGLSVYINALKNLEEMKTKKVLYAAAFTGKKFHLYKRMKRLVSHPKNSIISGRITSMILVFAVALVLLLNVRASMLDNSFYGNITNPYLGHKQVLTDNNRNLKQSPLYRYQDDTLKITKEEYAEIKAELKAIMEEMKSAMKDIEEIDMEEVKQEMQRAMTEMDNIDMEKIHMEMKKASEEMKKVDMEKIHEEIEKSQIEIKKAMTEFNTQHKEQFKQEIANVQKEMQRAMQYMKSEEFKMNIDNAQKQYQQSLIYIDSIRNSGEWQEAMNEVKAAMHEFNEKRGEVFQEYFEIMREVMHEHNEILFENMEEEFEDINEDLEEINEDLVEIQELDEKEILNEIEEERELIEKQEQIEKKKKKKKQEDLGHFLL